MRFGSKVPCHGAKGRREKVSWGDVSSHLDSTCGATKTTEAGQRRDNVMVSWYVFALREATFRFKILVKDQHLFHCLW